MKLYAYNVVVPFDYGSDIPDRGRRNDFIRAWWSDRRLWLKDQGFGRYHAYRVGNAFTCAVDGKDPPPGNHNISDVVIWSFESSEAAMMFKLTWG